MSAILSTTSNHLTTNLWQRFFSLSSINVGLITFWACPGGPEWKCHSLEKLYWWGRGGGGERGEALFPVPMPMCSSQGATVHILSEWERQVCVWLSYHLRKVFASVSADSGSHPATLSWWWIIKGPALPKNTDVCTCAHTLQTHMYICTQRHTHTDTKTLSLSRWMALHT